MRSELAHAFRSQAGPEVRRVGLFARDATIVAPMPRVHGATRWGRALGRGTLDLLLMQRAASAGALVFQPATAMRLAPCTDGHACEVAAVSGPTTLRARVVIAAHGSWERDFRTPDRTIVHRASDLLAFKAHFFGGSLPSDLMPLIVFSGGYGGMVHSDGGRVSLSLCIRRDALTAARRIFRGVPAGDAVFAHIAASCRGVREALAGAERDGSWLAAGPIRPGILSAYVDDVFAVGNLAGEAHPIIAEGISMAIQSGRLLAAELTRHAGKLATETGRARAGAAFSAAWRGHFATRVHAAALFAGLVMRPGASALLPLVRRFPRILTIGASLSGKTIPPPEGLDRGQPAAALLF